MENPFNHVTYSKAERVVVEAGVYAAQFIGATPKEVEDKQTKEKKWKLILEFKLEDGVVLKEWVNISQSDKSTLVKLLKTMGGLTDAIREDKDALWGYIKSKQGQFFNLMVTEDNGYNHITAATPMKSIRMSKPSIDVEGDVEINI